MRKALFMILLLMIACPGPGPWSQSNEGREFWFSFMEHRDVGTNDMVAMITSKYNTNGNIRMPGQNWSQNFSVSANQVQLVRLPAMAETVGSESVNNNGIKVTSSLPVSVYIHQYHLARSEASVILPRESLGKEYYVLSYYGVNIGNVDYPSEFIVLGMEDETEVIITVRSRTLGGKNPGTTFSVMLDAGETYQVQAATAGGDLTGSYIVADKKINVLAGARWTEVPRGCGPRDNLLEQMPPLETWGRRFVSVPSSSVRYDVFRILAGRDQTVVTVDGSDRHTYTLNAGEYVEYQESEAAYISADHPVAVAQYLVGSSCSGHSLGDPSMVMLNSVEQTRDTVTLYNSSFEAITENFINIITRAEDARYVVFDGQKLAETAFAQVGGEKRYAYARLRVGAGTHTILSQGCGVIATAYGYGNVESYAYGGGASFNPINANPLPEGGCLNDTVFFDSGLPASRYEVFWRLGDGMTSAEHQYSHIFTKLGLYPSSVIIKDLCLGEVDTLYKDLQITLRKAVEAVPDVLVCEGEPVRLAATDLIGARYEWTGPNGYFSDRQFPILASTRSVQTGLYAVVGVISGCATYPAITTVNIIPTPAPELGEGRIICPKTDGLDLVLDPGVFTTYRWQDNSSAATFRVETGGLYTLEVTDQYGCIGRDSVEFVQQCPTQLYAPTAFSPNGDGVNDRFMILGRDILTLHVLIYDRWGNKVFESRDPGVEWDGRFNGQPAPVGVYVWTATVEGYKRDGNPYTFWEGGSVTLVR